MKRGKKYIEAAKLIERGNLYEKEEAVALVKKAATAKFDETIEAHIRTGCDGRHADQQIRGAVVLPHGTGKKVRILVFAKDAKAEEAKAAGADIALFPEMWNCGYRIPEDIGQLKAAAVPVDGAFVQTFGALAAELDMAIAITFLEQYEPLPRNTVVLFDRYGKRVWTYACLLYTSPSPRD